MNKLARLIKELPYDDVRLIQKDLRKGTLEKAVHQRLEQARRERLSLCPICHKPVQEGLGWYLEFGPADLRKKATFDSPECLQRFLQKD